MLDEATGAAAYWQPALSYHSPDPYTWFSHPVATPARWAAWGQVDRALDSYLTGEMSSQPVGPPASYSQQQQQQHQIVKYSDNGQHLEAWDNEACEAAHKSALDAAHHARVAQGAATRLTLGNVGELVESVGALADTVRRMEERALLLHERDEARIKVLELENSLAREEALRHKAEQTRNLELVTIGAQTEQPVIASQPQLVAPAPASQQMIVPVQREDERLQLDEEVAAKLRAHERKVTALMEQSAALAEQQAKQALLLHERQTLMAERQLEAERRQLDAERRREEAERQRAESEQLGMGGNLQAAPKEERITKMPSSPDQKTMEELATARADIARLASTCDELRDRVAQAEAKQSTDSSGSDASAISRRRRRHRRKRHSRRRQGDSLDDDDIENLDAEQFRILPVGRKAEPLSEQAAAASAQRELDALRLQLRAREERDQARELAEATAARAKAEADLAEATREIREHRNRAEESALRLLEAERQRPEQLSSSSVARLVEDKLALEVARLRDESNMELRRERDRLELDRLSRERELADDAARRQRETENLLVKRVEELLSAVTAKSKQQADTAPQKIVEQETLVGVATENAVEVAGAAKKEDKARIEGGNNDDIQASGGAEDRELKDAKDEPEAEPVLYKTLSSNDEIDYETTTATPRSVLRFELPQRSSLDAIPGAEDASYGAYDRQEEAQDARPPTPLNDQLPDVLMTVRWAKAARSQRAVTITFGDAPVPSEESIRNTMTAFGAVSRCGRRQTTAVVLYVDPTSAARAAREYQGPWRVRRVTDALSPGPTPRSRQSSAGSREGRFFDDPQLSAPFSVVETSSRGFEMRTLDVIWGGRELAPKDDREFRAQFQFFGSIARSFRHDDRGMIMFSSPEECDRCLEEYRGPWRIARLATTIQRKPGQANVGETDSPHMSGSDTSPAAATVAARAVRCTFPTKAVATEDELLSAMSRFGTIVRARLGEASAIVMFTTAKEAERAIREYRGQWSIEAAASPVTAPVPVTAETTVSADTVRAASVKVAWNPGAPPPSERQLRLVLDEFGLIDRIVVRRRSALVLYRDEASAATALRAYSGPWRLRRLFRLVKGEAAIKSGGASPAIRATVPVNEELPTTRRRKPFSKRVQVAEVEDHPAAVIEPAEDEDHDGEQSHDVDADRAEEGQEEEFTEEAEKFPVEEVEQHHSDVGEDDDKVPFTSGDFNEAEDEMQDVEDIREQVQEEDVGAIERQDRARLERQERKRAATAELGRMSTLSESLASRCIKVSWRIRPKTDAAFAAALADMGIVYVKASPLREKSAVFMFADSEQAMRAVETINASTDAFRAQVVDQPRRGPGAPPPTVDRIALRERVRRELKEEAAPAPGLPALAERCVKVAWAKSKGPASEGDFEAFMTALGLTFISKVIRTNSAILMFASPQLARRAVDVINDRRGRHVTVANQKRMIEWTASIVASSSSSDTGNNSNRLTSP